MKTETDTTRGRVRLYFTREFIRGNLVGLTHNDSIPFVSYERAMEWRDAVNRNAARGKCDHRIIDASFQCYFR